jgi:hypothetical protein
VTYHEGAEGEDRYTYSFTYSFFNLGARGGGLSIVKATPRPLYSRERDPVPVMQEAGRTSGTAWTVAENVASTGIGSLGRPAQPVASWYTVYAVPPTLQCR